MKPRERVVTAEDVTSCLYYLHVDQPNDANLLDTPTDAIDISQDHISEAAAISSAITRKPLLPVRPSMDEQRSSFDIPRKLPPPQKSGSSSPVRSPARKPVGGRPLEQKMNIEKTYNVAASTYVQDRYRGVPNVYQGIPLDDASGNYGENLYSDTRRHPNSSQVPILPPRPSQNVYLDGGYRNENRQSVPITSTRRQNPLSPSQQQHGVSHMPVDTAVSLTLIRRDPSSGAQWNVAHIQDVSVADPLATSKRSKASGNLVDIEILTPGYSKFLYSDEQPPLMTRGTNLSNVSTASMNLPRVAPAVFRRRLGYQGTSSASTPFGHRRNASKDLYPDPSMHRAEDYFRGSLDTNRSNTGQITPGLEEYLMSTSGTDSQASISDAGKERRRRSFRNYTFTSPWNGICEFGTGAAGGSLKCKHVIPSSIGSSPNAAPAVVSELRFNLPNKSIFGGPRSPIKDDAKRHSGLLRSRHNRNRSTASDLEPELDDRSERLDLSLGQEQAGGGFGGKQAKLGKLILEDEGLKMMDLLVAANLGLWWRAYERTDGRSRP